VDSNSFDHISAKGGLGLQYFVCPDFSVGPQVNFLYVAQRNQARRHVDELTAGLFASFFFGGRHEETKAAAVPAPAPVPVAAPAVAAPAVVAVALNPSTANLGGAQTQQFDATVSNASNTGVNWSINPSLGSVSATGLYTAPTTVALPETVNITATSQADATKSATSLVHLTPPAQAAKQVNITLNVLFDTGKDVVKPDYNAEIQKVADFMKSYPSARAEIEGHTDSTGPADYNTELSQKRADSVRSYLISKFAIDASRLTAKGYGPSRPIADNKTKAGRAQNRRVVATLSAMSQS
jgi:OOP family OmpA-OmpF porin